jgi:hypothetical protein
LRWTLFILLILERFLTQAVKGVEMETLDAVVPIRLPVIEEPISIAEVGELGRKIKASYEAAAAHTLTTAELCCQGFTQWGSRGLPLLLRTAQMSKTTFMKFVVIGRDQRLRRIEGMLPPGFSIIYQVSQLSDEVFDEAVKAGVIHPHVRRAEVEALRKSSPGRTKAPAINEIPEAVRELTAGSRCELIVPQGIRTDQCVRVKKLLKNLHTKFGVQFLTIAANTAVHR